MSLGGRNRFLTITPQATRYAIIGGSGAGKTTVVRIVVDRYLKQGHRVLYLDGKGDIGDQRQVVAKALDLGLTEGEIRRWPSQPYDAWQGPPSANETKINALLDSRRATRRITTTATCVRSG